MLVYISVRTIVKLTLKKVLLLLLLAAISPTIICEQSMLECPFFLKCYHTCAKDEVAQNSAITNIGNRVIGESGNRGNRESGNMETVRGIGIPSVVSSTTTKYKSIPKKPRESPIGSSHNTQSKVNFLINY